MERLLLVLLCPPTVGSVDATIDTSGIAANRRQATTLLEGRLTNVHATRVTHTVRLTTAVFGTETILHEFLVGLGSHLSSGTVRVSTVMAVNTWGRSVDVVVLGIVTVTLEASGVLRDSLSRDKPLRTIEPETILAKTRLRAVSGTLRLLMLVARNNTRHTLRTTRHRGTPGWEMSSRLWLVMGQLTNHSRPTTCDVRSWTRPTWEGREPVFTNIHWVDPKHLLITTNSGSVGADTQTWTNQLLLYGGQVVHTTLVIHPIPHVEDFLTTTPLLNSDISETLHLSFTWNFNHGFEVVRFNNLGILQYRHRRLNLGGLRLATEIPTRIHETCDSHERNGISHSYFLLTFLLTYLC